LSVVDSGAPQKWGVSPSRTWQAGVYAVVAIKVIRWGWEG
jgi:hypothetical protein